MNSPHFMVLWSLLSFKRCWLKVGAVRQY